MNERIKELANQAGRKECALGYGMPEYVLWGDRSIEKFAEVLIRECIKKCQTDWYGDSLDDICDNMKEHFGLDHGSEYH